MNREKWKDIMIRAGKTFVQTALSFLIAQLGGADFFGGDMTQSVWLGLLLSAGAAGISAAWNTVAAEINQRGPGTGTDEE